MSVPPVSYPSASTIVLYAVNGHWTACVPHRTRKITALNAAVCSSLISLCQNAISARHVQRQSLPTCMRMRTIKGKMTVSKGLIASLRKARMRRLKVSRDLPLREIAVDKKMHHHRMVMMWLGRMRHRRSHLLYVCSGRMAVIDSLVVPVLDRHHMALVHRGIPDHRHGRVHALLHGRVHAPLRGHPAVVRYTPGLVCAAIVAAQVVGRAQDMAIVRPTHRLGHRHGHRHRLRRFAVDRRLQGIILRRPILLTHLSQL